MVTSTTIAQTVHLYDALHSAIDTQGALNVLYSTGGEVVKSRTIRPLRITIGPRGSDLVVAEDSLRGFAITMRIDRFVAYGPTADTAKREERRCPARSICTTANSRSR